MRRYTRRWAAAVGGGLVLAVLPTAAVGAEQPTPGSVGVGDPVFPAYGNGGYRVDHYDIADTYRPSDGRLTGTTTVSATSTQALSRFDLDLVLHATSVTVDGEPATFRQYLITDNNQHGGKLEITPARPVRRGAPMAVRVSYSDVPEKLTVAGRNPWFRTPSGAAALGCPEVAAWWFPSNDTVGDKARYDVALTAPAGMTALAAGDLTSRRTTGGWSTYRWRETVPVATYQEFAAFGDYTITHGRSANGIPLTFAMVAKPGQYGDAAKSAILGTGEVLDWEGRRFGPFPFPSGGGVLADAPGGIETANHPVYDASDWSGKKPFPQWNVVVHENAHQWFADSLTPANWSSFWLDEGFATFTEWLYAEGHGQGGAADAFTWMWNRYPATTTWMWQTPIGKLRGYQDWNAAPYFRGAMTLQALRVRLGDAVFFRLLRTWAVEHRHGIVTTSDFTALAVRISGQDLTGFFTAWLYTPSRPAPTAENGFPPALRSR